MIWNRSAEFEARILAVARATPRQFTDVTGAI